MLAITTLVASCKRPVPVRVASGGDMVSVSGFDPDYECVGWDGGTSVESSDSTNPTRLDVELGLMRSAHE